MSVLFDKMSEYSVLTEEKMKELTDSFYKKEEFIGNEEYVKDVFESFKYSLFAGGKRLRPFLALEFCRLCGADIKKALSYACAIEMIHTFSLIHDDLPCMDNDDLRRGKPTNHIVFGEACALLAGDALSLFAFEAVTENTLTPEQNLRAVRLLAKNAGICGMIAGQQIDMTAENKRQSEITEGLITLLQNKKTGCLFEASCLLGCIAAGVSDKDKRYISASRFASHIGLAFQIADDILDVCGDSEALGKTVGSDRENGKTTFVTLLGIDGARKKAAEITGLAKKELEIFEASGADCSLLYDLCDFIINRDH